jgi:hypothetical protein
MAGSDSSGGMITFRTLTGVPDNCLVVAWRREEHRPHVHTLQHAAVAVTAARAADGKDGSDAPVHWRFSG